MTLFYRCVEVASGSSQATLSFNGGVNDQPASGAISTLCGMPFYSKML